ncbi:Calx-beta domain-containing protein [Isosphaeraceae bacterium EP7]
MDANRINPSSSPASDPAAKAEQASKAEQTPSAGRARQAPPRGGPSRSRRVTPTLETVEARTLLSIGLVSQNAAGTASGNGASFFSEGTAGLATSHVSADGKALVFESRATDLVTGLADSNGDFDVFVRDLVSGSTRGVSVTPDGKATGSGGSSGSSISRDGRFVAFLSQAGNLSGVAAPGTAAGAAGNLLYVRDLSANTSTLLDATPDGKPADGGATGEYAFSADGRYLAWVDTSTNLDPAVIAANAAKADAAAAAAALAASAATPKSEDSAAVDPASATTSKDPAAVASQTSTPAAPPATTLAGPRPAYVYVRDLLAGTTKAVSLTQGGTLSAIDGPLGYAPAAQLTFSADGKSLAFASASVDLTAAKPAAGAAASTAAAPVVNLFVSDLASGKTSLASASADGHLASGGVSSPAFSPDGKTLAFVQTIGGISSVVLHDVATGANRGVGPTAGVASMTALSFSPDGAKLAFLGSATPGKGGSPAGQITTMQYPATVAVAAGNAYVVDLATGAASLASPNQAGAASTGRVGALIFSPDGSKLAYVSTGTDLTANPAEILPDTGTPTPTFDDAGGVYVRDLAAGTTTLISATPDGERAYGSFGDLAFSPDGTKLAFRGSTLDLTANPPNTAAAGAVAFTNNLYVRDLTGGTTVLVSRTPDGKASGGFNGSPLFSPNGQWLFFLSGAGDLGPAAASGVNLYVSDGPFTAASQVGFSSWAFSARQGTGQAVVTLTRTGPLTLPATVQFSVQDGTARAGVDFKATAGTVTFAPGVSTATVTVPLIKRGSFAGLKTARLLLTSPLGGLSISYPTATLNLRGGANDGNADVPVSTPVVVPSRPSTTPGSGTPTSTPSNPGTGTTTPSTGSGTGTGSGGTATGSTPGSPAADPRGEVSNPVAPGITPTATATAGATVVYGTPTAAGNTTAAATGTPATTAAGSASYTVATPYTIAAPLTATSTRSGPRVTGVTTLGTRRGNGAILVSFDRMVDSASASNPANYRVAIPGRVAVARKGGRVTGTADKAVPVASVTYNAATNTALVTLRTRTKSNQALRLQVLGTDGHLTDLTGQALNSPGAGQPGTDFRVDLLPNVRR